MNGPQCCGRPMLNLRASAGNNTWWCVRCGSQCRQHRDELPGEIIQPVSMRVPLEFSRHMAGLLNRLADGVDDGRIHYVNIPAELRTLALVISTQGDDRRKLMTELGL